RWFEDGGLADGGVGDGRTERDDAPRAHSEYVVGTGLAQHRLQVFEFLLDDAALAVGSTQTAPATVRHEDGEDIGKLLRKLDVVVGRRHRSVQQDESRAPSEPAVADGGSVPRRNVVVYPAPVCGRGPPGFGAVMRVHVHPFLFCVRYDAAHVTLPGSSTV